MTSLIDVSAAVAMLAVDTVSVSRTTRTYNDNGVLVLEEPETFDTLMSAQPAGAGSKSGLNVVRTRDGQRLHADIVFFSTLEIFAAEGGQQSDELTWQGRVFTVIYVEPWETSGYWRVVCTKRIA